MNCRDRFHAWGMGPRWPGVTGRQCQVWEVMWTAWDESAWSRVLWDVTVSVICMLIQLGYGTNACFLQHCWFICHSPAILIPFAPSFNLPTMLPQTFLFACAIPAVSGGCIAKPIVWCPTLLKLNSRPSNSHVNFNNYQGISSV